MPNKTAIIDYLDYVSEEARFCNAVNTVVNKEGRLYGYNTDIFGVEMAIKDLGVNVSTARCVFLVLAVLGRQFYTLLQEIMSRRLVYL